MSILYIYIYIYIHTHIYIYIYITVSVRDCIQIVGGSVCVFLALRHGLTLYDLCVRGLANGTQALNLYASQNQCLINALKRLHGASVGDRKVVGFR